MKSLLTILTLLLVGCVSTPVQKLNPATYYVNDICFTYETGETKTEKRRGHFRNRRRTSKKIKKTFCGVGVLPFADKYKLEINSEAKLDMFAITTCHREKTTHNADKGIFRKDGRIKIEFVPTVEKNRACPLYVGAFSRAGKHAWGVVAMESPAYQLQAKVFCNGETFDANGVAICQSRTGLMQKLVFPEPIKITKPINGPADRKEDCPELKASNSGHTIEFKIPNRECLYGIIGKKSYKAFQFYTIGYEELVVR